MQGQAAAVARGSLHHDEVILDVRIGSIASTVVTARRVGDIALLPLAPVLALAHIQSSAGASQYIPSDSLATLLHTAIAIDWDELTATITDDGTLPVSRRAARERQRTLLDASLADSAMSETLSRSAPMLPRDLIVDYDATTSGFGATRQTDLRLGFGANLLGGGLDVDAVNSGGQHSRIAAWSWRREFARVPFLRSVRVATDYQRRGSVIGDGVVLSSEPGTRAAAPILLTGILGPGWEFEAYRDNLLIYSGTADSVGNYAISIPAAYGANRLTIVGYGPADEQRSTTRYISAVDDMLPVHTTAYETAIGRCVNMICKYAVEATARYAPFTHLTTGVGMSARAGTHQNRYEPSFLLVARLRDDLNASLHHASSATDADVQYAPSSAFDAEFAYRSTRITGAPSISPTRFSSATANAVWRAPGTGYAANASLSFSGYRLGNTRQLNMAASLPLGSFYFRPFAELGRQRGAAPTPLEYGLYVESSMPFLPSGTQFRSALGTSDMEDDYLTVAVPFQRSNQLEMGVEWSGVSRTPRLVIAVNVVARATRYSARSANASRASIVQSLSGSLTLRSGTRSPLLSYEQLRGRASIAGTIFLDDNGNGIRDVGEPLLPDVSVSAGEVSSETDSSGVYRFENVVPYTPVVLRVDPLTLPAPDLTVQPVRVTPLPNGITRVDLPVARCRESGLFPDSCSRICGFAENPQRSDTAPIHGHDLETRVRNPNAVTDPREPTQSREYVPAECRPVSIGNVQTVVGSRVDE